MPAIKRTVMSSWPPLAHVFFPECALALRGRVICDVLVLTSEEAVAINILFYLSYENTAQLGNTCVNHPSHILFRAQSASGDSSTASNRSAPFCVPFCRRFSVSAAALLASFSEPRFGEFLPKCYFCTYAPVSIAWATYGWAVEVPP